MTPLKRAKTIQILEVQLRERVRTIKLVIRTTPYLPSLSKSPASAIDPAVSASTWAFGSQKWSLNTGIFTKKGTSTKTPENLEILEKSETQKLSPEFLRKRIKTI